MTQPALVRHRSFLMAALLTGAILDGLTVLTYVALGQWLNVLWLSLFLCVVVAAFVIVRDYRP